MKRPVTLLLTPLLKAKLLLLTPPLKAKLLLTPSPSNFYSTKSMI